MKKQQEETLAKMQANMEKVFESKLKSEIADFKEKTLKEIKSNNNSPAKIRATESQEDFHVPSFGALFDEKERQNLKRNHTEMSDE